MQESMRVSDMTYEEAVIAQLRAEGRDETTLEIMRIWLGLTPEEKRVAKARLLELDAEHKARKVA